MTVKPELLKILVCPKCKGELEYESGQDGKNEELACFSCRLAYRVEDDIPVLLVEDARELEQ